MQGRFSFYDFCAAWYHKGVKNRKKETKMETDPQFRREIVLKIHETPHKAVLAITGGGGEAIGELLRHGGGSNTVLEAIVPYDNKSFNDFVKGRPDKYCSASAARDLAMAAYHRAVLFTGTTENIIGLGCSCSLMKDHEREGREHHAYIAIQTKDSTHNYDLNDFIKANSKSSRNEQETKVSDGIIFALGQASGLTLDELSNLNIKNITYARTKGAEEQVRVISGKTDAECINKNGEYVSYKILPEERRIIFPGSFRPFHPGHARVAAKVFELTGRPVDLEINVRNVDKPAINYHDLNERLEFCLNETKDAPWMGNIFLTSLATFASKASYFPNTDFVVGWDTFVRINDWKYGNLDQVIATLQTFGARFYVFHRIMNGVSTVEDKTAIDPRLMELATVFGPDVLEPIDISSSQIRNGK